jgi:PhzF family phenazine biosynthesis protein
VIDFVIVDSFTTTPYAGNPAGVFFAADGLTAEQAMRLCREVSLESAFLTAGETGVPTIRYYTAACEVPLCGHATVAAVVALVEGGEPAPDGFASAVGRIGIATERDDGGRLWVTMTQAPPAFDEPLPPALLDRLVAALGLPRDAVRDDLPARVVSTGSRFLFVALRDSTAVDQPGRVPAKIAALSRELDALGVYVFALNDTAGDEGIPLVHSRCFAPAAGLDEDPVTGSASGALGAHLSDLGLLKPHASGTVEFATLQGAASGRPGSARVRVHAPDGAVTRVEVTGTAVVTARGRIAVPPP